MKTLGLCTSYADREHLDYEKRALYDTASAWFDQVCLIDPRSVAYLFERGCALPQINYRGRDLSTLHTLIVRSTLDREASTALLVRALAMCGCVISDPIDRFSVGRASKLLTTLSRFRRGVGSSSYIAFNAEGAHQLCRLLHDPQRYPLVAKPFSGKKGRGVERIDTPAQLARYVDGELADADGEQPLLLQSWIEIAHEYRVLVFDGVALGVVEKQRAFGQVAANAAQGGAFHAVEAPQIVAYTLANVSAEGLLGVDVALDRHGDMHIIETNRAPLWEAFEQATGIPVAPRILELLAARSSGTP